MAQTFLGGVLSFIAEGVIVFTSDGAISFINPHASLLVDHTSNEIVGKQIDDVLFLAFDAEPLTSTERIAYTLFTKKKIFTVPQEKTAYITSRSGRRFPVFISARTLSLDEGEYGVLVFRDITKEKQLETYKENTAHRLAELTPYLQRTATGDFTSTLQIPTQEDEFTELFVGLKLMVDDLREMEIQRAREQTEKIAAVKKVEEERRRLSEEYSKQLEKQVEEKTREVVQSKAHVESVIENLTSGLLEFDNKFRLIRMNRVAEELLGVNRGEVVGQEILPKDIVHDRWQALVDVSYPALSPNAKRIKHDVTGLDAEVNEITTKYPLERELQIVTAPVIDPESGERRGFIKLLRDITRERIISRSKSEFISIAAHQLRTPLSAIKWSLHMIINGDLGTLNVSQQKLLDSSYDTNEKMILLVNDLLNVARIEEGRFGYAFKEADVMQVVATTTAAVKEFAQSKNVTVNVETPHGAPQPFVFDASKLTLALQNLVDNAVKYTPAGGTVTVTVDLDGGMARIHVHDTGIGVPKDQIGRLFTKFFRAENAVHMQTSGSGLGLYLVKNIAVRHGGDVSVASEEGKGSTFTISLPLDEDRIPKEDTPLDEM